jgi:hypothetical protein
MKKLLLDLMTDITLLLIMLAIIVMICAALNAMLLLPSYIGWITTMTIIVIIISTLITKQS